jgi:hypothetical protein
LNRRIATFDVDIKEGVKGVFRGFTENSLLIY